MAEDEKKKVEEKITALKDVVGSENLDDIKKRTEALTGELNTLSQKLYAQAGQQAGEANAEAGAQGAGQGDDVVDADYEVVDEEEPKDN